MSNELKQLICDRYEAAELVDVLDITTDVLLDYMMQYIIEHLDELGEEFGISEELYN